MKQRLRQGQVTGPGYHTQAGQRLCLHCGAWDQVKAQGHGHREGAIMAKGTSRWSGPPSLESCTRRLRGFLN